MREKSKHKRLHYLQSSAFILMSDDACVCLYLCGLYWCSPIMCADNVTECVAFALGVHVVSATLLNSRIYVTCSYAFVFCHVSKFFFFVQFFQFIQFCSCRDFWWLRCNPATSIQTQSSSQSLTSGQEGRSSVLLVRRPPRNHLRVSGRGGWWHLGDSCLFILFLAGERLIKSRT